MATQTPSRAYMPGLIWTLVRTDFKTRYHGTLGGYLWALLKPMTMFLVLLGVFSLIFSMDPDYPINLVIGLFVWDFFAEATRSRHGLPARQELSAHQGRSRAGSWCSPRAPTR